MPSISATLTTTCIFVIKKILLFQERNQKRKYQIYHYVGCILTFHSLFHTKIFLPDIVCAFLQIWLNVFYLSKLKMLILSTLIILIVPCYLLFRMQKIIRTLIEMVRFNTTVWGQHIQCIYQLKVFIIDRSHNNMRYINRYNINILLLLNYTNEHKIHLAAEP
jgi:hypothetical protein